MGSSLAIRCGIVLWILSGSIAWGQPIPAQPEVVDRRPSNSSPESAEQARRPVRRIFVPESELSRYPGRFLPIERDRLLQLLPDSLPIDGANGAASRWTSIRHEVLWDGDRSVSGTTTIAVTADGPPAWALLSPARRWAVRGATWAEHQTETGNPLAELSQPAQVASDVAGRTWVYVDRRGELQLQWTVPLEDTGSDQHESFLLPIADQLPSQLTLTVPVAWRPVETDLASVQRAGPAGRSWQAGPGEQSMWQLTCVPADPARVTMARAAADDDAVAAVQQQTLARVTPAGIEMKIDWTMADQGEWFDDLHVNLPALANIIAVRHQGVDVAWSTARSEESDRQLLQAARRPSTETYRVPSTTGSGTGQADPAAVVAEWELELMMPIELGRLTSFPVIDLDDRQAQEFMTLDVVAPLTLVDFQTSHATYLGATRSPTERHRFRLDSPIHDLQIAADWEHVQLETQIGSSVEISPSLLEATVQINAISLTGECFELIADVHDDWDIDAVRGLDQTAVTDWNLIEPTPGVRRLVVRLRDPIRTDTDRRIEIRAQRRGTWEPNQRELSLADCWPLDVVNAIGRSAHIALRSTPPYRLTRQTDPGVQWLVPGQLSDQQRQLVATQVGDWLLTWNRFNRGLRFRLTQEQAEYQVELNTQVTVYSDRLLERYGLTVTASGPVRQLALRCFPPRTGEMQWSLEGRSSGQGLQARREPTPENVPADSETWIVDVPESVQPPFTIVGERTSTRAAVTPISLMACIGAAQQTSIVQVSVVEGQPPDFQLQGSLQPLPVDDRLSSARPVVQRRFTYSPTSVNRAGLEIRQPANSLASGRAWCWQALASAHWTESGHVETRIDYLIENVGLDRLRFESTGTGTIAHVLIDGQSINWTDSEAAALIPLPAERRFLTLTVVQQSLSLPSPAAQRVTLRALDLPIPVLRWDWTTWLPPGYQAEPIRASRRQAGGAMSAPWPLLTSSPAADLAPQVFDELLSDWGKQLSSEPRQTNWEQILTAWRTNPVNSPSRRWRVWLDREIALTGWPSTQGLDRPTDDRQRLRAALRRNGHALVADSGQLAIVGPEFLVRHRELLQATEDPQIWLARRPLIVEPIAGDLMSLDQLRTHTRGPAIWNQQTASETPYADRMSWNVVQASTSGPVLELRVYRPVAIRLWSITALLTVLGVMRTFASARQLRWSALALPAIALISLLVPPPYHLIVQAAMAGMLIHVLLVLASLPNVGRDRHGSSLGRWGSSFGRMAMSVTAFAVAAGWSSTMSSAELPADSSSDGAATTAAAAAPLELLIPIDDQGQPVGEYVWVPESWLRSAERAAPSGDHPADWMYVSATYDYMLDASDQTDSAAESAASTSPVSAPLVVTLNLLTQRPVTTWQVPFPREMVRSVAVDGIAAVPQPARPNSLSNQSQPSTSSEEPKTAGERSGLSVADHAIESMAVELSGSGLHEISLELNPAEQERAGVVELSLAIPPVARSTAVIRYPSGQSSPEFPDHPGPVVHNASTGTSLIHLGTSHELRLRWKSPDAATRPRVGLLTWAHVDKSKVRVELHAQYLSSGAPPGPLEIVSDQPLVMQSGRGPSGTSLALNAAQRFSLPWRPIDPDGVYRLTAEFLWNAADTYESRWRLPSFTVTDGDVEQQLIAFSISPDVKCVSNSFRRATRLTRSALESQWGGLRPNPDMIYVRDPVDPSWTVEVQPIRSTPTARSLAHHEVGWREIVSDWEIALTPDGVAPRDHTLLLPPAWQIDAVNVIAGSRQIPSHWVRNPTGAVRLFLHETVTDAYRVVLHGRRTDLPAGDASHELQLASCQMAAVALTEQRTRIQRGPDATVELVAAGQPSVWQPTRTTTDSTWITPLGAERSRVADLTASRPAPVIGAVAEDLRVTIRPDQSEMSHRTELQIEPGENYWKWTLLHRIESPAGNVDRICYELPASWIRTVEAGQEIRFEVRPSFVSDRAQLLIELPTTANPSSVLEISGSTEVPLSEVPQIAPILMLTPGQHRLRVVVPRQHEGQQLVWEGRGLRAVAEATETSQRTETYEVDGTDFRLSGTARDVPSTPRVRLIDTWLDWTDSSKPAGWTSFDFSSSGVRSCILKMPAELDLISVLVQNTPALAEPAGDRLWKLQLPGSTAPQHVRIIYQMRRPAAGRLHWELPQLMSADGQPWSVAESLITVASPGDLASPGDAPAWQWLSEADTNQRRLNALLDLVPESVALAQTPLPEGFAGWRQRVAAVREQVNLSQQPDRPPTTGNDDSTETGRGDVPLGEAGEVSQYLALPHRQLTRLAHSGTPPRLVLLQLDTSRRRAQFWGPLLALTAILVSVSVVLRRVDRAVLTGWRNRWAPLITLVAGGLLGWLIAPAWFGLLIAALGLWWSIQSVPTLPPSSETSIRLH